MSTITDFHSHILPDVDDGSSSLEESIAMLRMEAEQEISWVVATPHFYAHRDNLDQFLERRTHAEQQLREETAKHPDLPEILIGAEVSFFSGMASSEALAKLTIGNSKCILIEMPFSTWTDGMYGELQQIHDRQGLIPVIAHIDRYVSRFRAPKVLRQLEKLPVIVQGNAEAFLEKSTAPLSLRMLKNGQIHVLGSDCHNTFSRPPRLGEALQIIRGKVGEETIENLLRYGEELLGQPHKSLVQSTMYE